MTIRGSLLSLGTHPGANSPLAEVTLQSRVALFTTVAVGSVDGEFVDGSTGEGGGRGEVVGGRRVGEGEGTECMAGEG